MERKADPGVQVPQGKKNNKPPALPFSGIAVKGCPPMYPEIDRTLLEIRALQADDMPAAEGFTCGDADLDDFLRSDALRLQTQRAARTFVAVYEAELVGYVALLVDAIELKPNERKKLDLHFRDHPMVPALKIARLAVAVSFQGRGLGETFVHFAAARVLDIEAHAGCRLLTVDAYPAAVGFYERLGFVRNRADVYERRERPSMRFDVFGRRAPP